MWYQLTLTHCDQNSVETLSDYLETVGALSITVLDKNDEPMLEPTIGTAPVWRENILQVLFDKEEQAKKALHHLSSLYSWVEGTIEKIEDQDWQRASMDLFQPQQFGDKLWICPSWHTLPDSSAPHIILDPGLAFGTGTHPTTALCLTWLAQQMQKDLQVVDYGCGSGILALAALALGAKHVHAVDLDNQALQATANNAALNHISQEKLHISLPEQTPLNNDLVIANILLGPLLSLRDHFVSLLKPKGQLVLSGLLIEQSAAVISHYAPYFVIEDQQICEEWILLSFTMI
mgnify:CR=1 FL=1